MVGAMLALASQRSTRLAITNFMQFSCTEIARRTATFLILKELALSTTLALEATNSEHPATLDGGT